MTAPPPSFALVLFPNGVQCLVSFFSINSELHYFSFLYSSNLLVHSCDQVSAKGLKLCQLCSQFNFTSLKLVPSKPGIILESFLLQKNEDYGMKTAGSFVTALSFHPGILSSALHY